MRAPVPVYLDRPSLGRAIVDMGAVTDAVAAGAGGVDLRSASAPDAVAQLRGLAVWMVLPFVLALVDPDAAVRDPALPGDAPSPPGQDRQGRWRAAPRTRVWELTYRTPGPSPAPGVGRSSDGPRAEPTRPSCRPRLSPGTPDSRVRPVTDKAVRSISTATRYTRSGVGQLGSRWRVVGLANSGGTQVGDLMAEMTQRLRDARLLEARVDRCLVAGAGLHLSDYLVLDALAHHRGRIEPGTLRRNRWPRPCPVSRRAGVAVQRRPGASSSVRRRHAFSPDSHTAVSVVSSRNTLSTRLSIDSRRCRSGR
jgi:hypothetical protein